MSIDNWYLRGSYNDINEHVKIMYLILPQYLSKKAYYVTYAAVTGQ